MTDRANEPQQYWYVRVPKALFPKPKFHYGQQVGLPWTDEQGNSYYDIGRIIGMQYSERDYQSIQWSYRICLLKCDTNPSLVGTEDNDFIPESLLVADDTLLESGE